MENPNGPFVTVTFYDDGVSAILELRDLRTLRNKSISSATTLQPGNDVLAYWQQNRKYFKALVRKIQGQFFTSFSFSVLFCSGLSSFVVCSFADLAVSFTRSRWRVITRGKSGLVERHDQEAQAEQQERHPELREQSRRRGSDRGSSLPCLLEPRHIQPQRQQPQQHQQQPSVWATQI